MSFLILILILFFFNSYTKPEAPSELTYPLIPSPQNISYGEKEIVFKTVSIDAHDFIDEGIKLQTFLNDNGIVQSDDGLKIEIIKGAFPDRKNKEAYQLKIGEKVSILAETASGAFYGIQTLKQLFRTKNNKGVLPQINIKDWPAFKVRGFMHDTGRNFQSISQLKEQIEILSQYKYNVFHWHLTDNPGWRLESKIYPELNADSVTSRGKGRYYTQKDFLEVLNFCRERHIMVIPEFDIPGHTEAFRKAFGLRSMKEAKVKTILLHLFNELMLLADAASMPYIHIGTDEVRNKEEYIDDEVILAVMNLIRKKNRDIIVWKEGIVIKEDSTSINQLWANYNGREGHRFIDSKSNYINHLDPFAGMSRLFFQQPCRQAKGDELALGGILCAWPDNNINEERDILRQNPIYPSIVFYSDAIWKGRNKDHPEYWAKLPLKETQGFDNFKKFEEKVIVHRDQFFKDKEFAYISQSEIQWELIGPFEHKGDFSKSFPVEESIQENYMVDGQGYEWTKDHVGATIHLKHFFGFPSVTEAKSGTYYAYTNIYSPATREQDFWIGFHGWSRAGGRRGGPTPLLGQWHTTNPQIWVNDEEIAPPLWKQPGLGVKTDEIPFIDEDYFFRNPTKIYLKKGWNKILIKIPHGGNSWKWMFTCVPIQISGNNIREVKDLVFDSTLKLTAND